MTFSKIIYLNSFQDTFDEHEICELHEMPMITWAKVTLLTAKFSPFKKMIIYGYE